MAKLAIPPGVSKQDFSLFAGRVNNTVFDASRRIQQYVDELMASGMSRIEAVNEIEADLRTRGPLYRSLASDIGLAVDFMANRTFQRASNPPPTAAEKEAGAKFVRVLNPDAEHCDSCLYEASLPPKDFDEINLPGQQPTHGESNCREFCMCTIEAAP